MIDHLIDQSFLQALGAQRNRDTIANSTSNNNIRILLASKFYLELPTVKTIRSHRTDPLFSGSTTAGHGRKNCRKYST